jgi:uncharacterized protein YciU (UPF0263 family)
VKLPCSLETSEVDVVKFPTQYEEMADAELVDQNEWQVHGSRVMMLVFDLTVHADSVVILTHLRKFHISSTI